LDCQPSRKKSSGAAPSGRVFYLDHVFLTPIQARPKIETKPEKEITNALVTAQEKSSIIATILPARFSARAL
jgi:hypothetical protein